LTFPYVIYDAHHHLWDLNIVHYPWLATKGIVRFFGDPAPIQKNYLMKDLKLDIGNLPVEGSVHIQVGADNSQHLLESQTIQSFADESELANGIVAYCALEQPNRNEMLDELSKLNNFRGVRQIIGRSPEEDRHTETGSLLGNAEWLKGLYELERRSLSFDLQLIPDQMQRAAELFSKVPNLSVALCHCGSPWYRDKQGWELWKTGLKSLAEHPNIYCKISGLSMFDHNWTVSSLSPIIETVLEVFSPERCMFGSNFPVDKLHTNYESLWMAYLEIVNNQQPEFSEQQKIDLFMNNCKDFYKLN
jgi:predicted TIM-barrel fold metal-dependent hydrolase